jgi:hypothetical protein
MYTTARILFVSAVVAAVAWGQSQVATVTSSSPFTLRGANVNPGQGVPDWPVLAGDTIKAGTSPVVVTFPDGSTITLNPCAEATVNLSYGVPEYIHLSGAAPAFRLLKGSAHYSLKTLTSVQVITGNQDGPVTSLTGNVGTGGGCSPAGGPLGSVGHAIGSHTVAAVAAAGAAAGLGVGVSQATSGGPSVSPSH